MKFCPDCRNELTTSVIDSVERLCCSSPTCSYVYWNNPVPVIAAIVEFGDKVVLARNRAWPKGKLSIITGFLEKGETPEECVVREVKEELGLKAIVKGFVGYYSFFDMNQLILTFHVTGTGLIRLGPELVEFKLVPKHKLKPWSFGTGLAIRDWLKSE